jgi:hypothetical protein
MFIDGRENAKLPLFKRRHIMVYSTAILRFSDVFFAILLT